METRNGRVLVEFKQTRQIMTIKEEISLKHTSTRLAKTFKSTFSVCNECVNTQVFFFFINQVFFNRPLKLILSRASKFRVSDLASSLDCVGSYISVFDR